MTKIRRKQKNICPQCGAPITSEVCLFCENATNVNSQSAAMGYPTIDCKEVSPGFWTVLFPGIFLLSFPSCSIAALLIAISPHDREEKSFLSLFIVVFGAIGIASLIIMFRPIIRYLILKMKGKRITGTVFGYLDDNVTMNGLPGQVVKILVHTKRGPRFLFYQLGRTDKPYAINSKVSLDVYKDMIRITKDTDMIRITKDTDANDLW